MAVVQDCCLDLDLGLVGAGIYKMFTTVPYGLLLMGGGFLMIAGGILLYGPLYGLCKCYSMDLVKIRDFGTEIWERM